MSSRRAELLLLLCSAGAFLLLAEGAVRLLGAAEPRPTGYAPVNTNRRAMRPRNAIGYRDLERAVARPPGVRRVVSLGDSFAWGAGVEFDDAYPQRLERGLNRRRGEPWEVVNLALPGMNTVDHAAQLEQEGMAYGPDLVLLGFVLNDSEDATAAETRRAADWEEAPAGPRGGPLDRSALFRLVRTRLWATAENRRRVSSYRSMYAEDAPGWLAARRALRSMGALCRTRGVPIVVAIFPLFGNPLDEAYPFPEVHRQVAEAAAEAGAKVIDLLPAYRGLRWELLVVDGAADEHPNEIAHRIAAGVILRALDDVVPGAAAGSR
ncbi:MAG TPA: SGNH/GDSL hydrolase family protein [Vicinamibacteria bacterium]|nr:SGNH/GDSL hydrolase family protein [Vicinamibacteria bacterium]